MIQIPLTQGKKAKIDDQDAELILGFHWCAVEKNGIFYVRANVHRKAIYLHKLLLGNPDQYIDHINGDPLDNRRSNLRLCTKKENNRNKRISTQNTSGYKGVYLRKRKDRKNPRWTAEIMIDGRKITRASDTPELAAREYDKLARKYFKEFARTNFSI